MIDLNKLCNFKERKKQNLYLVEREKLICQIPEDLIIFKYSTHEKYHFMNKGEMQRLTGNSFVNEIALIKLRNQISGPLILMDNIKDYGNIGTIIRTAVAFGINNIIYLSDDQDFWNHKTIEASRSLIFKVNIKHIFYSELYTLDNFNLIGTSANGEKIQDTLKNNDCIIFGNETYGLSNMILHKTSKNIGIQTEFESLNVSIAAGIILEKFYTLRKNLI